MLRLAELSAAARRKKAGAGDATSRQPAEEIDGGSRELPRKA
jgi:hypothetical protein